MKSLKKIFTSSHNFSENENLQKFRFTLLHSLLIISILFTFINYIASILKIFKFNSQYEYFLVLYVLISIFSLFLLKKNKNYYFLVANISIISAFILFSTALLLIIADEFRLIWFFLLVFGSFILLGKKYGLFVTIFVLIIIFIINEMYELHISTFALFTFLNALLIFTAFAYFFLDKIEKDALTLSILNQKLKEKVSYEIHQREEQEQILLQQSRLASM